MKIQNPRDFLQDFLNSINNAEKSIYLSSMIFEEGPVINNLVDSLLSALRKGVAVTLDIDWVYQHYNNGGAPIFFRTNRDDIYQSNQIRIRTQNLLKNLISAGAGVNINNTPHVPLNCIKVLGRDHKKIYSVDKKVLWIGGINLYSGAFQNLDMMIKIEDSNIIDNIFELIADNTKQKVLVDNGQILIDRGQIGVSSIYSLACKKINEANKSIVFVSQYLPDYFMVNSLIKKAEEGLQITVHTSNKKFANFPDTLFYKYTAARLQKSGIQLIHHENFVHAKVVVVDDESFILGSHNIVIYGVILGTEEIAISLEDKNLVSQINRLLTDNPQLP